MWSCVGIPVVDEAAPFGELLVVVVVSGEGGNKGNRGNFVSGTTHVVAKPYMYSQVCKGVHVCVLCVTCSALQKTSLFIKL